MAIQEFLQKVKAANTGRYVLGNESGDLDSIACALCYAYFLGEKQGYVPILNFPKEELALRPEFLTLKIPQAGLFFKEDLKKMHEIVLVDHHTLALDQQNLAPFVVEIVDHHPGEIPVYPHLVQKECVTVGSLASLIASKLPAREWPADCAMLMYSAILLDTKNGQDPYKTTPLDERALDSLAKQLKRDRNDDYLHLKALKESLTPEQWLRKDLKSYRNSVCIYGIASGPSFQGLESSQIEKLRRDRGFEALFLFETSTKRLSLYAVDPQLLEHFCASVPFPVLRKGQHEAHFQCSPESSRKSVQLIIS
jgi:inorganic pyrophosphatase/exopolyphosphatase